MGPNINIEREKEIKPPTTSRQPFVPVPGPTPTKTKYKYTH